MSARLFALVFALAFGLLALLLAVPAAAADAPDERTLSLDEVWLTGDVLHLAVKDELSGEMRTFELNLSDYAESNDEFVTVQASDGDGNTSNAIRFKNPYYAPGEDAGRESASDELDTAASQTPDSVITPEPGGVSESSVPVGAKPFTPVGEGSVMDDASSNDGKEFFTVETADGNVFYLIVDRQRTSENVYLLNAVTERDLASLAKPGDGSESSVPTAAPPVVTSTPENPAETAPPPETPVVTGGGGTGSIIFIIIAALAIGGAGYYFKILRPKQQGAASGYYEDESEENFDDDAETDVDSDDEGSDGE
jgi:hypothetical protein